MRRVTVCCLLASASGTLATLDGQVDSRLQYVATVRQDGPVAYRDPLGVMSPDGRWLAFSGRGRQLSIQPIEGGAVIKLGPAQNDIRYITWMPDSRHVVVQERVFDRSGEPWYVYDRVTGGGRRLWDDRDADDLRYLTWSPDGSAVAGIVSNGATSQLIITDANGQNRHVAATGDRLMFPAWHAIGERVACLSRQGKKQYLNLVCGQDTSTEAYGPFVFSPDGRVVYYATPNERSRLDLRSLDMETGESARLPTFSRDAYAPSISKDGQVLFKTQDYRVFIAAAPAAGGPTKPLTTFMSETPSWDWNSEQIAFTFGDWRRVTDDINYPDITQHIGVITVNDMSPAAEPHVIIRQSSSEDQGMHWSPNGKWIAFHTHAYDSDDIWLLPADDRSRTPVPLSRGGHETGWPRWSPDGKWVLFPSYRHDADGARHGGLYIVGIDQETGEVVEPHREVRLEGFSQDALQAEWSQDSESLVFESAPGPGRKELFIVSRNGGVPQKIHEFTSNQVFSGISVSTDAAWVAYIAPASDGHYQVFRVPIQGGPALQVTFDPTDKTQPAYSPNGELIAFTVFSYQVHFWVLGPSERR